jgi:hypothetical protein
MAFGTYHGASVIKAGLSIQSVGSVRRDSESCLFLKICRETCKNGKEGRMTKIKNGKKKIRKKIRDKREEINTRNYFFQVAPQLCSRG